jgi:molecular chaperone DnaK
MPGRLAVDFGTSNTLIALWDETSKEGIPMALPEFSRGYRQGDEIIPLIPSVIHYTSDRRSWIGNQVLVNGLYHSERTFRWMKRYISHRSPIKIRIDDRELSHFDAGKDFLTSILTVAREELSLQDEEIALTVPVESYEHYENWLGEVADAAGLPRFRLIDEPSAAALGYGAHILPGNVYLIFDFGGGTMHAAVVLIEADQSAASGRRCRVLGKAGKDIGGASLDQWLFEEILKRTGHSDLDVEIRRVSNSLLVECEQVKEKLSFSDSADLTVMNPDSGRLVTAEFTRNEFEEILDQHGLYTDIDRTIRSALNAARERGYAEESVKAVLMVGGSSQVPSVQRVLRQIFGKERVLHDRPMDAVVRGGAAFIAGVDFFDHIQHDYAIRYVNPQKGGYDYRLIVPRGTPYPTSAPVSRLSIKSSYDGQTQLGLAIFEMGEMRQPQSSAPLELVFDPTGAVRLMQIAPDEQERRSLFWMNENNITFLIVDPPAKQGEPCFEVEFNIDTNKRLLITARDARSHRLVQSDFPVIKLT